MSNGVAQHNLASKPDLRLDVEALQAVQHLPVAAAAIFISGNVAVDRAG